MANRSKKDSLNFVALKKLHTGQECHYEQKKQLKRLELINSDCSLTVKGKTILYADMFGIPVESFKILALCYAHRKSQTCEKLIPVFYKLVESFFGGKLTRRMQICIKHLIDNNFVEKIYCQSIAITDSTYDTLKKYDADIVEIEATFEY